MSQINLSFTASTHNFILYISMTINSYYKFKLYSLDNHSLSRSGQVHFWTFFIVKLLMWSLFLAQFKLVNSEGNVYGILNQHGNICKYEHFQEYPILPNVCHCN